MQLQRGWSRFKTNRLGVVCSIIFALIFILSFNAHFLANDKPLLVKFEQEYYVPVLKHYPETTFGGVFETEAEYQDPVVQQLIASKGWSLWPLIPHAENKPNLSLMQPTPAPPSATHWLGTDDQGRDVLARILYALRNALLFSFALTLCSTIVGMAVGAIQGYYGGWFDVIGQRILEVWGGLPMLFLLMILVSVFSPNIYWLFIVMLFFGWTTLVSLVRAEFLRARQLDYVRAAKSIGVSDARIIFIHILPNVMQSSLSQIPLMLTANISALTALDFLGYGLGAEYASMGELFIQAKNHLDAPWLGLSAFFSLALVLALLIYIGEALRDAFDPKM